MSPPQPRMPRPRTDFLVIFAVLAVTGTTAGALGPLLIVIREDFGLTFAEIGLMFSAVSFAHLVANIPAGLTADRLPARVPIAAGGVGLGVGTLLMAAAPNYLFFLAGVLAGGLGATFMSTGGIAYIIANADTRRRGRATSRVMSGVQVGAFIGPALSGALAAAFDWRVALIAPALMSFGIALAVVPLVRREASGRSETAAAPFSLRDLRVPGIVVPIILLSMLLTGPLFGQRGVVLPLYAGDGLAFDPAAIGFAVAAMSGARALLTFFSGNLMDRAGRGIAFYAMVLGALGASLLLMLPVGIGPFVAAGTLTSLTGLGAVLPSVLIGDRAPKAYVGRSLGVLLTVGSLVQLGVAPAAGWLLDIRGFDLVGGIMACIVGAAGIAGWWIVGDTPWNRRVPDPLEHDSDLTSDHMPSTRYGCRPSP